MSGVRSQWTLVRCIEPRKPQDEIVVAVERELGITGMHDLLSVAGGPARRTDEASLPFVLADLDIAVLDHGAEVCVDLYHGHCGWVAKVRGITDKVQEHGWYRQISPYLRQDLKRRYPGLEVVPCYADLHPVNGQLQGLYRL